MVEAAVWFERAPFYNHLTLPSTTTQPDSADGCIKRARLAVNKSPHLHTRRRTPATCHLALGTRRSATQPTGRGVPAGGARGRRVHIGAAGVEAAQTWGGMGEGSRACVGVEANADGGGAQ
eukprot:140478-Chlamydomonas_euryale.AAC.1